MMIENNAGVDHAIIMAYGRKSGKKPRFEATLFLRIMGIPSIRNSCALTTQSD
jgi:hypothetical protein